MFRAYFLVVIYLSYKIFMNHQENYTAPRLVLAASGVEHEELLSVAEPLLSDLPTVSRPEEPKSVYTGGDYRCQSESGVCIEKYSLCSHIRFLVFGLKFVKSNIP